MVKKIVIIGPESTGKSTLSKQLADHYDTIWVREYAREFLLANGNQYTFQDLSTIARGQLALEDQGELEARNNLMFIDTDMIVMKVWCRFVFGKCHSFVEKEIAKRNYDLYLLCNTDLPWVKDELREYPDPAVRNRLLEIYRDEMNSQEIPWAEIKGNNDERLIQAIEAVDRLLSKE